MLTPTDVHFLVGFLSSVGQPLDVELELRSMVMDSASGSLVRRRGDCCRAHRGLSDAVDRNRRGWPVVVGYRRACSYFEHAGLRGGVNAVASGASGG